MRSPANRIVAAAIVTLGLCASSRSEPGTAPQPDDGLRRQCEQTMLRATRYMVEKVSTRGGYLWHYLPDLSRRWGEMEAYDTQIAVQPPGTPTMGQVFLDAYRATGNETFYDAAAKAA